MEKNKTLRKPEEFALSMFLSFSLYSVLKHLSSLKEDEQAWVLEQICNSTKLLFPEDFEA